MQLVDAMRMAVIDFEDVYKLFSNTKKNKWADVNLTDKVKKNELIRINKILTYITEPKLVNMLEIAKGKLLLQPTIVTSKLIKEAPLEDYNYTSGAILPVYKRSDEEHEDFNKRLASMKNDFNKVCAQYGYPEIHLVRGKNGIDLIYEALNEARR